jgi:hypothetical protein
VTMPESTSRHSLYDAEQHAPRRRGRIILGITLIVGTVVALLLLLPGRSNDPPGPGSRTSARPAPDGTEKIELTHCQKATALANDAIEAADASIDQWELHIDAMNQLVGGEITLDQARKFWAKSKVASKEKARAFRDVDGRHRNSELDCTGPIGADKRRAQCVDRLAAAEQALTEARKAVKQWEHHIHAMDLEAAGKLTPQQVTRMWLASWKAGIHQVGDYTAAGGKYRGAPRCDP